MNQEPIFLKLAQKLDALPNGFPATRSGVELRLLAKIFLPEEAALASEMEQAAETPFVLANRLGLDPEIVKGRLEIMADKGQIYTSRLQDGQTAYGLMPFVVGIYEEQLHRLDAEMAALFEQYYQESAAEMIRVSPPLHRVVPVGEAIPIELEIFPYERASQMVERSQSWAVRQCICRTQQRLVGKGCDHPVENCLTFAPFENAFDDNETGRSITKDEALRILRDAEEAGLVHTLANVRHGNYYICNCCTCCCGILRGLAEFDIPTAVARADFQAVVDPALCSGCDDCVDHCQFHALSIPDQLAVVDVSRCMGCGVCSLFCSIEAIHLVRRAEGETLPIPANQRDWRAQRMANRGLV